MLRYDPLRQMPEGLPLSHHPRRYRHLPAMNSEPRKATIHASSRGCVTRHDALLMGVAMVSPKPRPALKRHQAVAEGLQPSPAVCVSFLFLEKALLLSWQALPARFPCLSSVLQKLLHWGCAALHDALLTSVAQRFGGRPETAQPVQLDRLRRPALRPISYPP